MTAPSGPSGWHYGPDAALVVVDVQNDFADPAGSLYVPGAERVVAAARAEVAAATEAGAAVVYTQDWHPPRTPHFATDGGVWPVHCVRETWGARLHPELPVTGPVVRKGTGGEDGYSGFTVRDPASGAESSTDLEAVLRRSGATRLMVVGLAGDVCVRATALDARRLGWPTSVRWSAVACVNREPGDDERARADLRAAGVRLVDQAGAAGG